LVTKEDPNRDGAIYINLVKLSASRQCLRSCYALAVGDQSKFEDIPRSPESLATRAFSANGSSSKIAS
jgi:hypothetical protein